MVLKKWAENYRNFWLLSSEVSLTSLPELWTCNNPANPNLIALKVLHLLGPNLFLSHNAMKKKKHQPLDLHSFFSKLKELISQYGPFLVYYRIQSLKFAALPLWCTFSWMLIQRDPVWRNFSRSLRSQAPRSYLIHSPAPNMISAIFLSFLMDVNIHLHIVPERWL